MYLAFFLSVYESDAPALSTDQESAVTATTNAVSALDDGDDAGKNAVTDDEQWDDAVTASNQSRKGTHATKATDHVLDVKTLDSNRGGETNIAEKLRVEETKAQLAAAREGMEREAAKVKEEKEKKEQAKKEKEEAAAKSRFPGASASMGGGGGGLSGTGGKWVPPHMRGGGGGMGSSPGLAPIRMGAGWGAGSQKLDVADDELFPDLAAAGKILEKKEKEQQPVFKVPKKTPVGGGATWASKPKISVSAPAPAAPAAKPEPTPPSSQPPSQESSKAAAPASAAAAPAPAKETTTPAVRKTTKKKKKDLSTFKPKA